MGSSVMGPDYYCHQCHDTIHPRRLGGDDPICPQCSEGFVERIPDRHRDLPERGRRFLGFLQSPDGGGMLARRRRRSLSRDEDEDGEGGGGGGGGGPRLVVVGHSAIMDLMHALGSDRASDDDDDDDELRRRRAERERDRDREGLNVTLVLQRRVRGGLEENLGILVSDGSGGSRGLPRSLGDYFVGPGLDLLIQRLAENDPNRYGTPPAAKTAVDALPTVKISEEHMRSDFSQCVVCMEEFEFGAETRQMPCKHLYHPDCILPWLKLHSSCPVCRFQLATEDHDDTSGKKNPSHDNFNPNNSSSLSSSSSSDNSPQITTPQQVSNDNGASSSNNSHNGASSSNNNNDNGASSSSSAAPRGGGSSSGGRSPWWSRIFHVPESGGS